MRASPHRIYSPLRDPGQRRATISYSDLGASTDTAQVTRWILFNSAALALAACASSTPPLATAQQGVVFTYPVNGQLDVPIGSRIVVTFSDKVTEAGLGSFQIVGPAGAVAATPAITGDGKTVE